MFKKIVQERNAIFVIFFLLLSTTKKQVTYPIEGTRRLQPLPTSGPTEQSRRPIA